MSELVRVERRAAVAILTLDRPERMNALSWATVQRMGEIGRELAADPSVLVVILTGAGDKAFCAGADLKERQGMSRSQVREMLGAYRSELSWLEQSNFVSVAAINGVALGGGLELALTCDLRIAAPLASFGLPETGLGIIPGAGGTQRLTRLLGESRALDLVLTGRRIDASEALTLGLLNRVAPSAEELLARHNGVRVIAPPTLRSSRPSCTSCRSSSAGVGFRSSTPARERWRRCPSPPCSPRQPPRRCARTDASSSATTTRSRAASTRSTCAGARATSRRAGCSWAGS